MSTDAARCELINNTEDPDYWTQTLVDAYYVDVDGTMTYTVDTTNDWTYWFLDYADNTGTAIPSPFCTYDSSFFSPAVELADSIYNCTQIKCTMKRKINTGDDYDAWFQISET